LDEFSLQKAAFVDRAVEKALETNIPEEVGAVFVCEEVFAKITGKVG